MQTNGIELVLRSHEGPDAREDRVGMNDMTSGFSLDHDIEGVGKLCTVFSAPDYPQFVEEGERRFNGKAAFVTLTSDTDYCEPAVTSFEAVKPRPRCDPYYDVTVGGSDEEGPDGELAATIERNGTPMDGDEDAGDDEDDDGEDFAAAMGGGSLTVTESDGDTVSCDDETVVVEGYDASFVPDSDGEGEGEGEDHHGTKRPR
jgi:serine/threonine-protein phosphatase 5